MDEYDSLVYLVKNSMFWIVGNFYENKKEWSYENLIPSFKKKLAIFERVKLDKNDKISQHWRVDIRFKRHSENICSGAFII